MKILKYMKYIMVLSLLLLLPAYSYPSPLGSLRISLIEGDVQIRMEDTGEWVPASINMPLMGGDTIWVPEGGRTELQLRDGSFLRLDENSALEILTVEEDSFQFYLTEGRGYANFGGLRGSLLQIDTPDSSIRAYDRSNFRIETTQDGYTDISVYQGVVYVENRDGRTGVDGGNTLSLRQGTYAELFPLGPPDEWERWNRERDRRFAERSPSSRYLPGELQAYSGDFEENGRWVQVRDYGYVWTPTVVVSAGWAPYRIGRWVWIGGDYVWVSYEPWGWAPYHYGRWTFISRIGWCWVPPARGAVYWGPGFVGWVRTPTYVSWVPLAPREIYYGHGDYGPNSVNITRVNIKQIDTRKIVYRNIHVHNAVTTVHHDTFVRGRPVDVKIKENPFLKEKISLGGPDIKPEKATAMPIIKEIPQRKRPPEPIREIKVKELKKERPLVKEKEGSVLKPESPARKMPVKSIEKTGTERPKEFRRPAQRGIEEPKEVKPERKVEKPAPIEKGFKRPKEVKPTEKEVGRPRETRLPEKPGPVEKEVEKPKEFKPAERGVDKPKEVKPTGKGIERPAPIEKQIVQPKEYKPVEGGGKPPEFRRTEKRVEKPGPLERGVEKPKEFKPRGRGVEKPKEFKPAEGGARPREFRPPEKRVEKPGPAEKPTEKPRELEKLRERKPEKETEK